jgi:hypothetical protein
MAVTHRSLSVAVESSFGSLSASTGLPDNSGLTFVSIPCERDPIIIPGEPVVSERNDARDGNYMLPPEPDTVWSGSSRVRRRTGQVVCRVDLTTIGSAADNYDSNYLGYLLGAGLKTQNPSITNDSVTGVTANSYTQLSTALSLMTLMGRLTSPSHLRSLHHHSQRCGIFRLGTSQGAPRQVSVSIL